MLPMHAEVRPADLHWVVYRWRSADYVQRFGHHVVDTWAAVEVRCKIVSCSIEAFNLTQKKMK
jgi:hypothetical protein